MFLTSLIRVLGCIFHCWSFPNFLVSPLAFEHYTLLVFSSLCYSQNPPSFSSSPQHTHPIRVVHLKAKSRGTLFAPFWCLCQKLSLSPLYFNKTLLHKSSERSNLVSGPGLNSFPPGAKNPGVFTWFNNNLSSWGLVWDPSGQGKDAWSFSSLFS